MIARFNMGASAKLSILLADEDALRRDGLSAVLSGNFEVISSVADGESALTGIRTLRPDVAVIDLNLPRVHGIELIRRVRAESLATKIIIMSSTDDADIVREAVRAGVDGYLLKNGPSRHLIDAIAYVHDGGQYF
ncbi:MAG: DNA-binding response regulator, partial [Acidobacteriia bacterium]|nr:DNA-binding response regulator [Terriglobia bacterium]